MLLVCILLVEYCNLLNTAVAYFHIFFEMNAQTTFCVLQFVDCISYLGQDQLKLMTLAPYLEIDRTNKISRNGKCTINCIDYEFSLYFASDNLS